MKKTFLTVLAVSAMLFACTKPANPDEDGKKDPIENPDDQDPDGPENPDNPDNPGEDPDKPATPETFDIFLCIGQSNMAGRGELIESDKDSIPGVWILKPDGGIEKATNPLNKYSSVRKDLSVQQMSPAYGFCTKLYEKTEKPILLVVNAKGGTGIGNWIPNSTSDTLYSAALRRTKQSLKYGTLKGIIWHQGESNASTWTTYMGHLKNMVDAFRSDLGMADLPFVAGEIHHEHSNAMQFNKMIQGISESITNSDWVSAQGLTLNSDHLHHDRASQIVLGGRYADAVYRLVYDKSAPAAPVYPELYAESTSATLEAASGSTASVKLVTNQTSVSAEIPADAQSWLSCTASAAEVVFTALSAATSPRETTVKLTAGGEKVSVTVKQKAESQYKVGVAYGTEGVIFWVNDENPNQFKIISAKSDKRPWGPEGKVNGVNSSKISGPDAAAKVREADDYATESYAQQFCDGLGEGWYIPTRDECDALFLAYDGETYFAASKTGTATQDVPDKCTEKEKAARTAFENTLLSIGGDKLNTADWSATGDSIWLCMESSNGKGYYYRFGSPGSANGSKASKERWARCVRVVTVSE